MDIEKIVSELMEELNLKAAHNDDEMYDIMKDAIGEDRTMMYLRKMDGLIGDKRFYDAKYEEPRAGYAYSGIYDGEFYPVLADWLKKNETKFGSEVLDVGCDCGIITCLMARMFPSSHFTAVDRSRNAIAAAEKLAERLNITNVEFLRKDVRDLKKDQVFDTVCSFRTAQENRKDYLFNIFAPLPELFQSYQRISAPYAEKLASHVRPNGYLLSVERMNVDPMFYNWLRNLNDNGCVMINSSYEELTCNELDTQSRFLAFASTKANPMDEPTLMKYWLRALDIRTNGVSEYDGYQADLMLDSSKGDLIEGYYIYDPKSKENIPVAKCAVYDCRSWTGVLLFYHADMRMRNLKIGSTDEKDLVMEALKDLVKQYKSESYTARPFNVSEDGSEKMF